MGPLNSNPDFIFVVAQDADNVLLNAEDKLGSKATKISYYAVIGRYRHIYRISEYLLIVPWQS